MGKPEWLTDERFSTTRARRRNAAEMISLFDAEFATKTVAEWGEIFDEYDVWWVPLQRDHHVRTQNSHHCPGQLTFPGWLGLISDRFLIACCVSTR